MRGRGATGLSRAPWPRDMKAAGVPGRSVFERQLRRKTTARNARPARASGAARIRDIFIQRSRPQQRASRCCASP